MRCIGCGRDNREGRKFCADCGARLSATCPDCGTTNEPGENFCGECGGPLGGSATERPSAVRESIADDPLARNSGISGNSAGCTDTRKIVTVVFADLAGSTALHEGLDPESARTVMARYYEAMRNAVEACGGTVVKLLGDGVMAAFGVPQVAEDDAIRAVQAAVAMADGVRALGVAVFGDDAASPTASALSVRVAVNTGEVVVSAGDSDVVGDPVNVAARLQQEARHGEVVIGEATQRMVAAHITLEPLGLVALKGRGEAVKAYRVVSLQRPVGAKAAAFVGRDDEMARLAAVYQAARDQPATRLAVLLGSPGLGKSRLIDELGRRLGDEACVIRAQCDAAGGATFAPIAEALRAFLHAEHAGHGATEAADSAEPSAAQNAAIDAAHDATIATSQHATADTTRTATGSAAQIPASNASQHAAINAVLPAADQDRTRILRGITALLAGAPEPPEETFFVIRRFLAAAATSRPVVLVLDDLHWAEPLLLDLVEHLVQWGSGVPLFVLVGSRPELRERRSSLASAGGLVAEAISLGGLDAGAAMRLAANVIGAADLPATVAAKVLATSEGNPLFVGELVRMLVDEGALERQGERWIVGANLAALEMPPTIHAVLAARIERLRPEERTLLERASVVGRHFSRSAVAALLPDDGNVLDARLEALRRTELIEPDTGWFLGEPVLRFHHVLIRDAAYRRVLKGTRAELHARLAAWIEARVGDDEAHDEVIGRHLEQAHQLLRELGQFDAAAQRLGERAAARLSAAGRRALARDDLTVAADLLGRAIDRLGAEDTLRADLALDWCEALLAAGDVGPAAAALQELDRFAARSDRLRAWHTCFAGQHTVLTAPSALESTIGAVAAAADSLAALGDAGGEAKAHFVHALALSRLGKVGSCEVALDRALAAARRAGDRRRANTVLAIAPLAALWGPSPVTRASGRCLDVVRVLRITQGAPAVEAVALCCQGVLEALRGRTEAASRMIASARTMVEELGITHRLLETDVSAGLVALLEGEALSAERSFRRAYEGLRDLGLGVDAARAAALLAKALLAQSRVEEAEALSHESELLAGDDLKAAIAWRGVRAEALARRGEHAAAVELASKAVEMAAATDALLDHADARLALAAALRAAGRSDDADAEETRTKELWLAKGATLLVEGARRTATTLAAPSAAATSTVSDTALHIAENVAHSHRRRLRPNYAILEAQRAEAAVAARDAQAVEALYRPDIVFVDHVHGLEYEHDAVVERVRLMFAESTDGAFRHDYLATLGEFLALCRLHQTASGSLAYGIPVGETASVILLLIEADEEGCARRIETFRDDALGDAVVRLYERHAECLPEGPARERAVTTARVMRMTSAPFAVEPGEPLFDPDIEVVDHRIMGSWSASGAKDYMRHLVGLREVARDAVVRDEEILALGSTAVLLRRLHSGTDR
ncbi:MAG: AAA family ATPase, partial [Candidatus Binatia bacterium]